ncbi:MAG: hypothetical protein A3K77_00735 [Euryarchaeota archaeon RBG_13_31_8]|nr:MAG: hypothetical protein A3K77_00735 [Euryarchaeota archaeon RBG_13_31_8]
MKTITVSDETYELIKNKLKEHEEIDLSSLNDFIGKKFFIRTVTYHLTGRVKKIVGTMLLLEDAAWIASSCRFMNTIKEGTLNEVEPVGIALVNLNAVTDMFPWNHDLPMEQK